MPSVQPTVIVMQGPGASPPVGGGANNGAGVEGYAERAQRLVRLGFIRKVYGLLVCQLAVTFAFVSIFTFVPRVRDGVRANPGVLWGAVVLTFGFLIALSCFPKVSNCFITDGWSMYSTAYLKQDESITLRHLLQVATRWPQNVLCLAGFTLAEGYLVGAIASVSGSDAVILAVGGTVRGKSPPNLRCSQVDGHPLNLHLQALITAGLTLFAWQTKVHYTALTSAIFAVLLVVRRGR